MNPKDEQLLGMLLREALREDELHIHDKEGNAYMAEWDDTHYGEPAIVIRKKE